MTAYDPDNIFAKILRGDMPCHKLYEDEHNFAFMDIMPRCDGHCLVIPKSPARNILDIDDAVIANLYIGVAKVAKAAKQAFGADGLTIQQFNEPAGGQVVFHMHVHVLPRMAGVSLRPHTGEMERPEVLAANAEKIRALLAAG